MYPRPIKICASLTCADFLHLGRDIEALKAAGVDYLHIDVMDGTFVPNYCLSPATMRTARRASDLPMDVHLMIEKPERYLDTFIEAGADVLVIHQEASTHLQRTLARIQSLGCGAGVALNPATSLHTLEYVLEDIDLLLIMTVNPGFTGQKLVPSMIRKIADARAMFASRGLSVDIMVDGNVSFQNAAKMTLAGANWLVGGTSSVFMPGLTIAEGTAKLRRIAVAAQGTTA